jgi:DNA-binding CsgD family transcriptional regulator
MPWPNKVSTKRKPSLLVEIADATDYETAMCIARAKGGTRCYFPVLPQKNSWITQLVGIERATLIGKALGTRMGIELLVPMGPTKFEARQKEIMELYMQGKSVRDIALALNIHERTVQYHKSWRRNFEEFRRRQIKTINQEEK